MRRVSCWGDNRWGQLGDGSSTQRRSPITITTLGSPTATLALGSDHSCALSVDGSTSCWGSTSGGSVLGNGSTYNQFRPTAVQGDVIGGFSGLESAGWNTCGLRGAAVYCWGWNDEGQVGDLTTEARSLPTKALYSR